VPAIFLAKGLAMPFKLGMSDTSRILKLGATALLILVLILLLAFPYYRTAVVYDEGFALTNAIRVMRGDVPFLDFWSVYPPGTSYSLALFFSIFEPTIETSRAVHLVWVCLLIASAHRLLMATLSTPLNYVATALVGLWSCVGILPASSMAPALALALVCIAAFIKGYLVKGALWITVGGLAGGLIVFFRHDVSFYLFSSFLVCYCVLSLKTTKTEGPAARDFILRFSLIYLITTLLALTAIIIRSGITPFIEQALIFPAMIQREQRFLPFPGFTSIWDQSIDLSRWLLAWLTPCILSVAILFVATVRRHICEISLITITITWMMTLLLLPQALGRLDLPHVTPSMIFLVIMTFSTASALLQIANVGTRISVLAIVTALIFYSIVSTVSLARVEDVARCLTDANCSRTHDDQTAVVDFINQNVPPDEPIFVGNLRHDRIHINDALLYFLLNRPIPTKWNEMHPGEVTTAQVQTKMVEQLKQNKVSVVILVDMPSGYESNASEISSSVFVLDTYLWRNFSSRWRHGRYTVMLRDR